MTKKPLKGMPPEARLKQAAQLLRAKGWTQSEEVNEEGAMCAIGAWRAAGDGMAALRLLAKRVCAVSGREVCSCELCRKDVGVERGALCNVVTRWNDERGRTKRQVLAVFDGRGKAAL